MLVRGQEIVEYCNVRNGYDSKSDELEAGGVPPIYHRLATQQLEAGKQSGNNSRKKSKI